MARHLLRVLFGYLNLRWIWWEFCREFWKLHLHFQRDFLPSCKMCLKFIRTTNLNSWIWPKKIETRDWTTRKFIEKDAGNPARRCRFVFFIKFEIFPKNIKYYGVNAVKLERNRFFVPSYLPYASPSLH